MKNLKFIKEDNRWYIDLPSWEGSKADLEMVSGADVLLDHLSNGSTKVSVNAFEEPLDDSIILSKIENLPNGADYSVSNCSAVKRLWLCDVTKYVYGYMPKILSIKLN